MPAPPPDTRWFLFVPTPSILQFAPVAFMPLLNQPQHTHKELLDLSLRRQVLPQKLQQLKVWKSPIRDPSRQFLAQPLRRYCARRPNLLKRHPVQFIHEQGTIQQPAQLHPGSSPNQIRTKQPQSLPLPRQLFLSRHHLLSSCLALLFVGAALRRLLSALPTLYRPLVALSVAEGSEAGRPASKFSRCALMFY